MLILSSLPIQFRIAAMYLLCGSAFVVYILKVPECLAPGAMHIFGHSHQGITKTTKSVI